MANILSRLTKMSRIKVSALITQETMQKTVLTI